MGTKITHKTLNELKDEIKAEYQVKLVELEETFNKKFEDVNKSYVDVMEVHNRTLEQLKLIVTHKDEQINNLKEELAAVKETVNSGSVKENVTLVKDLEDAKQSLNFLTKETTDLNEKIVNNTDLINETAKQYEKLEFKTVDLEDRSRRNNLIFYNIEEEAGTGRGEHCESKVVNTLYQCGVFNSSQPVYVSRAHRLGKKLKGKTRPIIVCFQIFKQKEYIIRNAKAFKDNVVNVSEDYSRQTLALHKQLVEHGKTAKNNCGDIVQYRVQYRRLVVTYKNNKTEKTFVKGFTLREINQYANWYSPRASVDEVKRIYNNDS